MIINASSMNDHSAPIDKVTWRPAPSVAVALGGGGARGLAHLGAMEIIGESGVQTERIVGVSIGSLIGGLCAVERDNRSVQAKSIELLHSPVFSEKCRRLMETASRVSDNQPGNTSTASAGDWFGNLFSRIERLLRHGHRMSKLVRGPSVVSDEILSSTIEQVIPDIDIAETEIPLTIVAADLISGHLVALETGPLRAAIQASTAIPGFFPPVRWGDQLLCDVGVLDAIPTSIAKSYGADLTIAVDVGSSAQRIDQFRTAIDVIMRMEEIGERLYRRKSLQLADIVIRPKVGHRPWYDFGEPTELIEAGRRAARKALRAVGTSPILRG